MTTTQDLLMLVLSIAVGWVAVFLCWALYEAATLLHQANRVVSETREKLSRLERAAVIIKDKLEHSVTYLGMLAEGGKSLLSLFKRGRGEEEEEDEEPARSKGKRKKKSELFDE